MPVHRRAVRGPAVGIGVLHRRLILAIMVLPFITAIMRDVFETVPPVLKEAAYGIGSTTWEVVGSVVLPYTRVGVVGGIMLGLGRALGETMAVTFVIGNAHRIRPRSWRRAPRSPRPRQRVHRGGRRLYISSLIALGLHPVRDHLHRAARSQADAAAARTAGGEHEHDADSMPAAAPQLPIVLTVCRWSRPRSGCSGCALILWTLLSNGHRRAQRSTCSPRSTPPPGSEGGLLNAIFGSLVMTVDRAPSIGTPIGILAGTYLAEYGRDSALATSSASSTTCCWRALDHRRPVRLRDHGGAAWAISRPGPARRARHHRHAGHRAHHRGHAAAWCPTRCARPPRRSARRTGR